MPNQVRSSVSLPTLSALRLCAFLLVAVLLGLGFGCAGPTVRIVRDPLLEVSSYRTWNWFPRSELPVAALGEERVKLHQAAVAQIEHALEARGLRQSKNSPDLLVTYQLIVQRERHQKVVQTARESMWSGRVNVPNIHVDPQRVVIEDYDHADLVIALARASTGQVVWAGRLLQTVRAPFDKHMEFAVAQVLGRIAETGDGTNAPDAPQTEHLLAAAEASFADTPLSIPQALLFYHSGPNGRRGPRYETSGSPQSGLHW